MKILVFFKLKIRKNKSQMNNYYRKERVLILFHHLFTRFMRTYDSI